MLTYAFDLWERAFHEIGQKDYPDIKRDYTHVDATTHVVREEPGVVRRDRHRQHVRRHHHRPRRHDPGRHGRRRRRQHQSRRARSMFEPMGGSAPKYTGKNVINPLAAICAGQMLLDYLGETKAAKAIEDAVIKVTGKKIKSLAAGKMGYSTTAGRRPGRRSALSPQRPIPRTDPQSARVVSRNDLGKVCGAKRQRTAALQDAGAPTNAPESTKRLGVWLSPAAFSETQTCPCDSRG